MDKIIIEKTMHELVEELENNYTYILDHFFTNLASKSVDVTIRMEGTVIVIPNIYDISGIQLLDTPPYLYFIPSHFVSDKSILNTNIADMVQVYAFPEDQIKLTLIKKDAPTRDELEIQIDSLRSI